MRLLAAAAAASALGCVLAQDVNCTSCQKAQAHSETGKLTCFCTVDASNGLFSAEGVFNFSTYECSRSARITGEFRGDEINETVDDVHNRFRVGSALGCDVYMTLNKMAFSESGIFFCPHLDFCGLQFNQNQNEDTWCVNLHEDDECLAIEDCEGCLADPRCGWCNTTGHCLLRNESSPGADKCDQCSDNFFSGASNTGLCPLPPPPKVNDDNDNTDPEDIFNWQSAAEPPHADVCESHRDQQGCVSLGCVWTEGAGTPCSHYTPAPTPLPTLFQWPWQTSGGDDGDEPTPSPFGSALLPQHPRGVQENHQTSPAVAVSGDPDKFGGFRQSAGGGKAVGTVILTLLLVAVLCACGINFYRAHRAAATMKVRPSLASMEEDDVEMDSGSQTPPRHAAVFPAQAHYATTPGAPVEGTPVASVDHSIPATYGFPPDASPAAALTEPQGARAPPPSADSVGHRPPVAALRSFGGVDV
eukprot:TRINITY_DN30879_c0_g1_i1.p1 TRINITY_DN30879_c0_g1~~TRINITY_DN30879_c0_g1_i1.p1  ORF type:complete len:473 (+),score=141.29 TRINITY_DN30879_c0_g1_i1:63-1481(+)